MTYPAAGDLAVLFTVRVVRVIYIKTLAGAPCSIGLLHATDPRYSQPDGRERLGSFTWLDVQFMATNEIFNPGDEVIGNITNMGGGIWVANPVSIYDLEGVCPMVARVFESAGLPAHAAFLKRLPTLWTNIWDWDLSEAEGFL